MCRKAAPRSVQHRIIAWNSDVLTTAARLCPHLDHSFVTAATEAIVYTSVQLLL